MSIRAAMDNPEPVEPTMVSVPDGLYCIPHGVMDCDLPFCWRCGNHQMDDFERCADPKCRASNDPTAREAVEEVKRQYPDRPAPIEVIALAVGLAYMGATTPSWRTDLANPPRNLDHPLPSLQPGEPGRGAVPEPLGSASGAGE